MSSKVNRNRRLELERIDAWLRGLADACHEYMANPPGGGWIRFIRQSLGMSAAQLARKLTIPRTNVYSMEKRETQGSITLKQLDKVANILNCDVYYAFVPRSSVKKLILDQARDKAEAQLVSANKSMGLEAEGVEGESFKTALSSAYSYVEALDDQKLWDPINNDG